MSSIEDKIFTCSKIYEKCSKRIVELLQRHLTSHFMGSVSVLCVKKRAIRCVQNTTNKNWCNDLINQKEK